MLNINQNFDLKAPVFNFDRDYFNSVEELNAYDTSNVPNHFVTNVAGMLYLFTDGAWIPMIGTTLEIDDPAEPEDISYLVNLIGRDCYINKDAESSFCTFYIGKEESYITIDNDNTISMSSNKDDMHPNILINQAIGGINKWMQIGGTNKGFGLTAQNPETGNIQILTNKNLTLEEQDNGYSPVDISLTDGDNSTNINAKSGFTHRTDYGYISNLRGDCLSMGTTQSPYLTLINSNGISCCDEDGNDVFQLYGSNIDSGLILGSNKFKIFCPINGTKGATITGIKSLTAFDNPSATKVWATDGSTVDLTTKANKSDIVLKKNSRNGYYIGDSNDSVGNWAFSIGDNTANGSNSFASGYDTKAYGSYSHVEGYYTEARGESAHAEGDSTYAYGIKSHSEGNYTRANGLCSHAEGFLTSADGYAAHALGVYNVDNKNAIHIVGIGKYDFRKNAEYIYVKNNTNGTEIVDDPKNGYKYLIGVGGYDGISTDNSTYKSVQEVIADLTARIEQLETKVRALEAANTPA